MIKICFVFIKWINELIKPHSVHIYRQISEIKISAIRTRATVVGFSNKIKHIKFEAKCEVLKWVTMYVLFSSIGVRGCEGGGVNLIPILTQSMATLSKELYLWQLCQIRETTSPS